ncbi:hypothetical protein OQA88_11124 [Cercophora sp. LCS_1]
MAATQPSAADKVVQPVRTEKPETAKDPAEAPARNSTSNRYRLFAVCLISFVNALSDTAPSALIPFMERYYSITPGIISLIFVASALGFIIAAVLIEGVTDHLGRAKTYALAQTLIVLAYVPIANAAPFPALVISFFIIGFGASFNLALGNIYCGSLPQATSVLGAMHAVYGVGAMTGPYVASIVAEMDWTICYASLIGLTLFSAGVATHAFWDYEKDASTRSHGGEKEAARKQDMYGMFTAFSTKVVVMGALFIFAYRFAEVSLSSWAVRGPNVVFWAGITIGRLLLWAPAQRLDERKVVYGVIGSATCFELMTILAPGLVSDATGVGIVGLLLGPVYPCAAAMFMRKMAEHEQVGGIGVISAFGSAGAAAAPFTAGVLAELVGPFVLHPIAIALFGVMVSCWYGLPRKPKRRE